ncbi:Biopolymer transport protein ExbD/TolR [compost metagenome]|jgi:biopolymer transport protein ExbD|uniref:ExbD/TolR family protein n=1 Tax=Pedobacter ghigonis TaxID=2730403 RepID=UPI000FAAE2BD|nr:biopolymer transporter ExbD [Pedobacter ghigonis]|eukprot:TRINITY_DN12646_c0_g2_i1.p2 TRINITY_DN12646_c0_g2~~TRINITY_DN12646_c0_g2_i1.p2  ORF type:complete len:169 (+),score=6.01 TRINITY_DN12646_c0_g2_i1:698-1204(+)
MAELNTGGKKATPRVDMTPMVDLMFLLVTFFILTTSISTPQAMDIVKPDKDDNNKDNRLELKASKTMTILLGKNDKVAWYMGEAGATAPTYESLAQVDKSIIENRKKADASGVKGEFVVLVKPTSGSNFKNFVDIMDELEILKVKVRQIDDDNILDSEKESMKSQGIL